MAPAPETSFWDSSPGRGQNRFGVAASLGFNAKASFMSDAFTGTDVEIVPGEPVDITVGPGEADDREHGAFGGEFFYERVFNDPAVVRDGVRQYWGLHIGFGYQKLEFNGHSTHVVDITGNPILASGMLDHDLEADMYLFNVGLFSESYLSERFYATLGAGISGAYVNSDYTVAVPFGLGSASNSESDFLYGGYITAMLGYDITENFSIFAGLRYQYLESLEIGMNGAEAEIDFEHSYTAFLGLRWSF